MLLKSLFVTRVCNFPDFSASRETGNFPSKSRFPGNFPGKMDPGFAEFLEYFLHHCDRKLLLNLLVRSPLKALLVIFQYGTILLNKPIH